MLSSGAIFHFYLELLQKHGSPKKFWPQWCAEKKSLREREVISIGAILTQRTSWHNAHLALVNLKKEGLLSLQKIANLSGLDQLTSLVRPAGFYRTKPRRLFNFCSFVIKEYDGLKELMREDLSVVREKLLALYGIGPETADTILLYALDKPTFVIDEYTKRFIIKRGLTKKFAYDYLKEFFEKNLPRNVQIYQNFHTLIIIAQKGKASSMMQRI